MNKRFREPWVVDARAGCLAVYPEGANGDWQGLSDERDWMVYFQMGRGERSGTYRAVTPEQIDVAHRVIACVNACEDISTVALKAGVVDELVKSLQWAMEAVGDAANALEGMRTSNQFCDCASFGYATEWLNKYHGGAPVVADAAAVLAKATQPE